MKFIASHPREERQDAFTLIDLLTLMLVLTVLLAVALPALAMNKGQARIAQCKGNLRQFALAWQIYGQENNNLLPANVGAGSWAWDMSLPTGDALMRTGLTRNQCYDPGFAEQNSDVLWNIGGGYRVIGYAMTIPGAFTDATEQNSSLTPQDRQQGLLRIPAPPSSGRVLTACATLCNPAQNPTIQTALTGLYNFTSVQGLAGFNSGKGHRAPHLNSVGKIPAGGNVGMLDGHVEWRPFTNMSARVHTSVPIFWW